MEFRKDINGLRAIAVMAVVIFHFNSTWLPGGFAGVDIFFVISGYLMTSIIFTGLERGNFRIFEFYKSRARRIIPALTFACLTIIVFGWFFIAPTDFQTLNKHVLSSLLFVSNLIYWQEAGYFDIASKSKWLLHTWSLSVEWQFYIIYPLFLVVITKVFSLKMCAKVLAFFTVIFFVISVFFTHTWPDAAYYVLPARCWEMMIGGLVFLFPYQGSKKIKTLLETVGFALVLISLFIVSEDDNWPGVLACLPVLGAVFILVSNNKNNWLLNLTFMQKLGKWSYSIYLWHWLVVACYYYFNPQITMFLQVMGIIISIVFGYLSFQLIEVKKPLKASFITYLFLVVFAVVNLTSDLSKSGIREITAQYERTDWVARYKGSYVPGKPFWFACNAARHFGKTGELSVDLKCIKNQGSGGVILWGDSHAGALSASLAGMLNDSVPYNQLASTACTVSWNDDMYERNKEIGQAKNLGCNYQNDLMKNLVKEVQPNTVIIVQARDHQNRDLVNTGEKLRKLGVKNVVILGPVPQWLPTLPQALSKYHVIVDGKLVSAALDQKALDSNEGIKGELTSHTSIKFVDIIGSFCIPFKDTLACKYKVNDRNLMTFDYGHPTQEGAKVIVEQLVKPILDPNLVR